MNTERLTQLLKFLEEDPHDAFNWYAVATEYRATDPDRALVYFEKLLTEHPDYVPTYYHAAQLYLDGMSESGLNKYTALAFGKPLLRTKNYCYESCTMLIMSFCLNDPLQSPTVGRSFLLAEYLADNILAVVERIVSNVFFLTGYQRKQPFQGFVGGVFIERGQFSYIHVNFIHQRCLLKVLMALLRAL